MPDWDAWKEKAWASAKKAETTTWRVLDPVGQWSNRMAGKFGMEGFYPAPLNEEVEKCARIVHTFTQQGAALGDEKAPAAGAPSTPAAGESGTPPPKDPRTQKMLYNIPPGVLREAKGVAIFTVFRMGISVSGASGSGVVITRDAEGEWGAPSGILVHTLGWGLVLGADIYDVVLVLRDERAINAFKWPKVSIGGELSVSAGPVGNGALVDAGVEGSPCFSYIKSKGLYVGVQLDGTVILARSDENSRFYNYPDIPVTALLENTLPRHQVPHSVLPLWQALCAGEGRPEHLGTDKMPLGPSPGDTVLTDEQVQTLQAEMGANAQAECSADAQSRGGDEQGSVGADEGVRRDAMRAGDAPPAYTDDARIGGLYQDEKKPRAEAAPDMLGGHPPTHQGAPVPPQPGAYDAPATAAPPDQPYTMQPPPRHK
ncbi:hypothetical protein MSPP1_002262 [Malassezia sp. CBS 17886]|nr:hypothetical protein MSPP1_002262 [Malassezia sp. CBS 17886]